MARVPRAGERSVQLAPDPIGFQQFDIPNTLDPIGKAVSGIGVLIEERIQEYDKAVAQDIDTEFTNRLNELALEQDQLTGQEAWEAREGHSQQIDSLVAEYEGRKGMTRNQLAMLSPVIQNKAVTAKGNRGRLAEGHRKKFIISVKKNTADSSVNEYIKTGEEKYLHTGVEAAQEGAKIMGEDTKAARTDLLDEAHRHRLDQILEADAGAAKDYFEKNREDIYAKEWDNIEAKLKDRSVLQEAQETADEIIEKYRDDPEAQAKAAKDVDDPKVRDDVLKRVKAETAWQKALVKEAREKQSQALFKELDDAIQSDAPRAVLYEIRGRAEEQTDRSAMDALIEEATIGPVKYDDPPTYDALATLAATDPETFVASYRSEDYVKTLTPGSRKQLADLKADIITAKDATAEMTRNQIVINYLNSEGVENKEKRSSFIIAHNERVRQIEKDKPKGQKASPEEMEQAAKDLMKDIALNDRWPGWWDTTKKVYELGEGDDPQVPPVERAEIIAQYKRPKEGPNPGAGRSPTEQEIFDAYKEFLLRGSR